MNPYDILGIPRGSSKEVARAAFRRLAMRWHPDRVSITEVTQAQVKFVEIKAAWEQIEGGYTETVARPQPTPRSRAPKPRYYRAEPPPNTWRSKPDPDNIFSSPRPNATHTYRQSTWESAPPPAPLPKIVEAFEQEWLESKMPKKNLGEFVARPTIREAYHGFVTELNINGETKQFTIPAGIPNGWKKSFDADGGKIELQIKFLQSGYETHTTDKAVFENTFVGGTPASVMRTGALAMTAYMNDKEFANGGTFTAQDFLGKDFKFTIPPYFNPHNPIKVEERGYVDWFPAYERPGDKRSDLYIRIIPYRDGTPPGNLPTATDSTPVF